MQKKSILITGCSSGIGKHTALRLKERGYHVFAAVRQEKDLKTLQALGLHAVLLDVTDETSMQSALADILKETNGTLDALFNNAGMLRAGAIEDLTSEMIRAQFETNVFGPMALTRMVLPIMRKQGHGRIIQNSSILGVICIPLCGAYNASKYALEGFSSTLRQELRGTNIHVSLINPGPIESALRHNAHQLHQDPSMQNNIQKSAYKEKYDALETSYFKQAKSNLSADPKAVSDKVIHALESKNPRAHYFVGTSANILAFLRRVLPDGVIDWMVTRVR